MTSQGWRTLSSDGRVNGLAFAYVDDFLIAVDEESANGLYDWGPGEHGTFTQCGVQIVQT